LGRCAVFEFGVVRWWKDLREDSFYYCHGAADRLVRDVERWFKIVVGDGWGEWYYVRRIERDAQITNFREAES